MTERPQPVRRRDPHLDNVKAVLVVLVVVGHAIGPITGVSAKSALFAWIYSFHMAAFAAVSGHLSRRFAWTADRVLATAASLLVPYLVVAVVQAGTRWAAGDGLTVYLLRPGWSLWFLLALLWWRLAAPALRMAAAAVPGPPGAGVAAVLAGTVAVCLAAGLGDGVGQWLALGRTMTYLPFFTLGLFLDPRHLAALRGPGWSTVRVGAVAAGASAAVAVLALRAHLGPATLQMTAGYDAAGYQVAAQAGGSTAAGMAVRLAVLALGVAGGAAVAAVTPTTAGRWTAIGRRSMYVYALQAAVLYPLRTAGHLDWVDSAAGLAVVVCCAVVLAAALASPPVVRLTRPVLEPDVTGWLARRRARS